MSNDIPKADYIAALTKATADQAAFESTVQAAIDAAIAADPAAEQDPMKLLGGLFGADFGFAPQPSNPIV